MVSDDRVEEVLRQMILMITHRFIQGWSTVKANYYYKLEVLPIKF